MISLIRESLSYAVAIRIVQTFTDFLFIYKFAEPAGLGINHTRNPMLLIIAGNLIKDMLLIDGQARRRLMFTVVSIIFADANITIGIIVLFGVFLAINNAQILIADLADPVKAILPDMGLSVLVVGILDLNRRIVHIRIRRMGTVTPVISANANIAIGIVVICRVLHTIYNAQILITDLADPVKAILPDMRFSICIIGILEFSVIHIVILGVLAGGVFLFQDNNRTREFLNAFILRRIVYRQFKAIFSGSQVCCREFHHIFRTGKRARIRQTVVDV